MVKNKVFASGKEVFCVKINQDDGKADKVWSIIPKIYDVRVFRDTDGNLRHMRMEFADGTYTEATLREGDTFDFDMGLSICITKKLLDQFTDGMGTSVYNKLVQMAGKVYRENREFDESFMKTIEAEQAQIKKRKEKKHKALQRRKARQREEQIEIQKEAYLRAMEIRDEKIKALYDGECE